MEEVIEAVNSNKELPKNALLLTFDDGYIDNFTAAFPLLMETSGGLRNKLSSILFEKYVGLSEADFSRKLYMNHIGEQNDRSD